MHWLGTTREARTSEDGRGDDVRVLYRLPAPVIGPPDLPAAILVCRAMEAMAADETAADTGGAAWTTMGPPDGPELVGAAGADGFEG